MKTVFAPNNQSVNSVSGQGSGFTLIEVLVALTIFTVAAVAATSAATSYTRSTEQLRSKTYAHFVAKNRMADILINQEAKKLTNRIQTRTKAFGLDWLVVTQSAVPNTQSPNLKKITIQVLPAPASPSDVAAMANDKPNPITELVFYHLVSEVDKDKLAGNSSPYRFQ